MRFYKLRMEKQNFQDNPTLYLSSFFKYLLSGEELDILHPVDWHSLYSFSKKQSIIGTLFPLLNNDVLISNGAPPKEIIYDWCINSNSIKNLNIKINKDTVNVYNKLINNGFRCCILKGQGNNLLYKDPYSRTPGDIDIWVNAPRNEIINYVKNNFDDIKEIRLQHISCDYNNTSVEFHYTPSFMFNPVFNNRLQNWFLKNIDIQCSNKVELPGKVGKISIPTNSFNVIYQLSHIYRHFFEGGIGLRQITDYYYVIKEYNREENDKTIIKQEIKYLGLDKFAGAVMYVLNKVMGLDSTDLIFPADKIRGELLLNDIMKGGNFGHHNTGNYVFKQNNFISRHIHKTLRIFQFARLYPYEAINEPLFRFWHFLWRMKTKLID